MTVAKKPAPSLLSAIGGLLGAVGGWGLSEYCRGYIWLPSAVVVVLLLLMTKTPLHPKWFGGAIAIIGAQITWFVMGSGVTNPRIPATLDIILLSAGIVLLWMQPGLAVVLFLGVVQLASLVISIFELTSLSFGTAAHRALTAQGLLQVLALICLVFGFVRYRRDRAVPTDPSPAEAP